MARRKRDPNREGVSLAGAKPSDMSGRWFAMSPEERDEWVLSRCSDRETGRAMLDRYPEPLEALNGREREADGGGQAALFDVA